MRAIQNYVNSFFLFFFCGSGFDLITQLILISIENGCRPQCFVKGSMMSRDDICVKGWAKSWPLSLTNMTFDQSFFSASWIQCSFNACFNNLNPGPLRDHQTIRSSLTQNFNSIHKYNQANIFFFFSRYLIFNILNFSQLNWSIIIDLFPVFLIYFLCPSGRILPEGMTLTWYKAQITSNVPLTFIPPPPLRKKETAQNCYRNPKSTHLIAIISKRVCSTCPFGWRVWNNFFFPPLDYYSLFLFGIRQC